MKALSSPRMLLINSVAFLFPVYTAMFTVSFLFMICCFSSAVVGGRRSPPRGRDRPFPYRGGPRGARPPPYNGGTARLSMFACKDALAC